MARGYDDDTDDIFSLPKPRKGGKRKSRLERWGSQDQPYYHPGANPASDIILTRNQGQEVLLVRRSDGIGKGKGDAHHGIWSLPGGFQDTYAEKGELWRPDKETAAETALRELWEETGLDLRGIERNLHYVGFFPHSDNDPRNNRLAWSHKNVFSFDLPAGVAEDLNANSDAQEVRWFKREEVESLYLAFSQKDTLRKAGFLEANRELP